MPDGTDIAIHPDTEKYLREVEEFAGRKFRYRPEIGKFIELLKMKNFQDTFEEIIFLSKFIVKSHSLLGRGYAGDVDMTKLSLEFSQNLERVSMLLRGLLQDGPADFKNDFEERFLAGTAGSLERRLAFLYEVSWIKNYEMETGSSFL